MDRRGPGCLRFADRDRRAGHGQCSALTCNPTTTGGALKHFPQSPRGPCRILIVDDAPSVRESLGWVLLDEPGLTVIGDAATGSEALYQATSLHPDLVILDIELPDTDGFVVTRQLKALPQPPLVVLLSIHSDDLSRQRGAQAGCDAFVEKGLGWPGLLSVLQQVLNERQS